MSERTPKVFLLVAFLLICVPVVAYCLCTQMVSPEETIVTRRVQSVEKKRKEAEVLCASAAQLLLGADPKTDDFDLANRHLKNASDRLQTLTFRLAQFASGELPSNELTMKSLEDLVYNAAIQASLAYEYAFFARPRQ
jgi:hypothetical protein